MVVVENLSEIMDVIRTWQAGVRALVAWTCALWVIGGVGASAARALSDADELLPVPTLEASVDGLPSEVSWDGHDCNASTRDGGRHGSGSGSHGADRPRPGPNVPEPMVFDLIRPLGVRQGELEANVLGFVPLRRAKTRTPQFSFITGSDLIPAKRSGFEWAPEIECGLFDNFALEFELPMSDVHVEAFKGAAQYTFGTAFDEQFIHGVQGILFVDRTNGAVTPALLYLAAVRFDPVYSGMVMVGFSHEFGGSNTLSPTLKLLNGALFAEVSPRWTLGVEANYVADLDGTAGLLFMPQVHWNLTNRCTLQFGAGTRSQEGSMVGECVFRLVREF